jgi:hypothetical protein
MPEIQSSFDRGIFAKSNEPFYDFFVSNLEGVAETVKTWEGYGQPVADMILRYRNDVEKTLTKLNFPSEGSPYNLLIHGDFHFKNMMFIREEDRYKKVIFVDYQMCVYSSGVMDLIYGLYNAVSHEVRTKHRDEIIKHYYTHLVDNLHSYGYQKPIPSLYDLHMDLLKAAKLEVVLALLFTPFISVDFKKFAEERPEVAEKMDFNDKSNFDDMIRIVYEFPENVQRIKESLDRFIQIGLLE